MSKKKKNTAKPIESFMSKHMRLGKIAVTVLRGEDIPATMIMKDRSTAFVSRNATEQLRLVLTLLGTKTKMRRVTVQFGSDKPVLSFDLIGQSGTSVSLPMPALGRRLVKIGVRKVVFANGFDSDSVLFDKKDQHIKSVGKAGKSKLGLKPKPGSRVRRGTIGVSRDTV